LKNNSAFKIVSEANNGKEVIDYLQENLNTVDVVLMDINMPEMNGIEATDYISKNHKNVKVLALSMHDEESYIKSMVDAGALGYILKESGTSELVSAIKSVEKGKRYYSSKVSVTLINSLLEVEVPAVLILSGRESEILGLISKGLTSKKVGEFLCISKRTVETHRRNILSKLNVKNTVEMVKYAIENDLYNVII
jgi:DNA-binding NarL/FixJ family response regulator